MEDFEQALRPAEGLETEYSQPIESDEGSETPEISKTNDLGFTDSSYDAPIDGGNRRIESKGEETDADERDFLNNLLSLMPERQPYSDRLIQNKRDGLAREDSVLEGLCSKYDPIEGYDIFGERYLVDSEGRKVKDLETGSCRRIDFVVVKDGRVVDSIEVTSETADKTEQVAKEGRIRENGGVYIRNPYDSSLIQFDDSIKTRIERRA